MSVKTSATGVKIKSTTSKIKAIKDIATIGFGFDLKIVLLLLKDKTTRTCVNNDSTNHPVWKVAMDKSLFCTVSKLPPNILVTIR